MSSHPDIHHLPLLRNQILQQTLQVLQKDIYRDQEQSLLQRTPTLWHTKLLEAFEPNSSFHVFINNRRRQVLHLIHDMHNSPHGVSFLPYVLLVEES